MMGQVQIVKTLTYSVISMSFLVTLLLVTQSLAAISPEDSLNIINLKHSDFPAVFTQYPNLVILFYQPWCGLCKRLAPIYKEVVADTRYKHPLIQFGKIDATSETLLAQYYNITKYPTIKLFIGGYSIPFNSEKTKEEISKWIDRKLVSAVYSINSERELKKLSLKSIPSVVIFGFNPQQAAQFNMLALADDNNIYYNASVYLLKNPNETRVELYRNFDSVVTYTEPTFEHLQSWISDHSKPYIQTFNRDLLRKIFSNHMPAAVFFNTNSDKYLHRNLSNFAKSKPNLIFTEIDPSHELFSKFANYLSLDVYYPQIVIIEAKHKNKILYPGKITTEDMTQEELSRFFERYEKQEVHRIGITDPLGHDL